MRKKPDKNKAAASPRELAEKRLKAKQQRPSCNTPELQRTATKLAQEFEFEKLMADLSARFVSVSPDQVDREIEDAQRSVCECLGLDQSTLWQWSAEKPRSLVMTHLYQPSGFPPVPERMIAEEFFPWCQKQLLAGKVIVVSSMDELPAEAVRDREVWRQLGVKTTLAFPLSMEGEPAFGAMSFNDTRRERIWPEELVNRLQLVAQIFAGALARQRSDRMLRDSEERLEMAADSAGVGLWMLNLSTGCYWLTRKTRELFGFSPDETVTYDRFLSMVHPEDRELVRETVQRLVQSKNEGRVQYRIVRSDGSLRWISSRGRVRCKALGEADSLMGVSMDITERKLAEEVLRASEEVCRATFEQAAVGMAHVGTDGRFLRVNDKLCAIAGYPRNELLKITFQDITHPDDLEADLNLMRQLLSGEIETYSMEKRYIRKDRSVVWIYLTVSLVRDDTSAARHFISVVEDITARKNAEEELKRLRLHLWHADRVAQTAAVTASLAHELNQPLAAILSNAEAGLLFMAGGNPDLEEIREILTDIVQDDKRAGAVVGGLRDLLRRKETRREIIDLADTIRRMIEMLHSELLDKQVQLQLHLEPGFLVVADKAQVQQVILNLVMNSVEAMQRQSAGQRRLELSMMHTNAGEALVAIRDLGPGIPDDWHEKVFEAFWTTKPEGLGIGLMISRSIVESHNGRLWFANSPDQGVTFYFTLPLIIDIDPAGPGAGLPAAEPGVQ
jgi:PAS domain S-box-containing protein